MTMRHPHDRIVTIFGGSGFIGRNVVRRLAKRGWRIRVPTRNPAKALALQPSGVVGQIAPLLCNVRDDATVRQAIEGADYVVNLVGILSEWGNQTFDATHYQGNRRIAIACRDCGVDRFVFVSAIGADLKSESHYARTKAGSERAAADYYPEATILRPSVVFGSDDGFINRFAQMARIFPVMPLVGGGKTRFQPVYVADAVVAAIDDGATAGQTYELGGPRVYAMREILSYILKETGRKRRFVSLPFFLANLQATFFQLLPDPMLTTDQVALLKRDNVVSGRFKGLSDLGISPTALELIAPTYLDKYRPGGRFSTYRRTA